MDSFGYWVWLVKLQSFCKKYFNQLFSEHSELLSGGIYLVGGGATKLVFSWPSKHCVSYL